MNTELTERDKLNERLAACEFKRSMQERELKEDIKILMEQLRPSQIIKSTVKDFFHTPSLKNDALKTTLGWAAGLVTKKLIAGPSAGIFNKLLQGAVQFGVMNLVKRKMNRKSKPSDGTASENRSDSGMY